MVRSCPSPDCLLDEICDPLEAVSNLVYLIEDEAENSAKVREHVTRLSEELARVLQSLGKRTHYRVGLNKSLAVK